MEGTIDILEHPSDIGFRATAARFEQALDLAVRGLARIEASDRLPAADDHRPVELEADDDESLVVSLLEECLYLVDAEDWLATGARVQSLGHGRYRAVLYGSGFPAGDRGVHVKAITWHQLAVERREHDVTVTVFVDI